jgi:hypothetical protein
MEEYGLTVVQEDNALGHMGYAVNCRICNKVSTLWWPPNSPDINPIKSFWRDMKGELQKQVPRITKEADMIKICAGALEKDQEGKNEAAHQNNA